MRLFLRGVFSMTAGIGSFFWILVHGIEDIGEGFKTTPTDGWQVLAGLVEVFLLSWLGAFIALGVTFWLLSRLLLLPRASS